MENGVNPFNGVKNGDSGSRGRKQCSNGHYTQIALSGAGVPGQSGQAEAGNANGNENVTTPVKIGEM